MHTRTLRPLRRDAAAGAVALTALLVLAGCSSAGDTDAKPKSPHRISDEQAAALPDDQASPAPQGPSASSKGPSASSKGPVLPDAQLTPATGSFTAKEKKYLHGRVPRNMDPAAVLQAGQETCQRFERTAAHDKDAAIGALITKEVPTAEAAIKQLCPTLQPLLSAAATGFADGARKNPEPGTYRALTTAENCTWKALGSGDKVLASGPGPGGAKKVTAKVAAGTRTFVSSGCYAWLPVR
ncbi:hypothetical protein [Streptomyces carpinensis]|uniref:Lipoprotein n=1 Tax=Streptomyces carpinensis TaxID=66369 RepID=A0ABV1W5Y7_9ACTN|nr:hypothetical protein [Streptomyces carpinensis]